MREFLYKITKSIFKAEIEADFNRIKRETTAELEQKIQGTNKANRAVEYTNQNLQYTIQELRRKLALKEWEITKLQELLQVQPRLEEKPEQEDFDTLTDELYN